MRITLVAGILLLLTAHAQAQVYKWTDAQGRVHYSAQPPPGAQASEIRIAPAPPSAQPAPAAADEVSDTAAESPPENHQDSSQQAIFRQNCEIARQNLAVLQDLSVRRFSEDGEEAIYYSDEQRQAKIEEAQEMVATYCD